MVRHATGTVMTWAAHHSARSKHSGCPTQGCIAAVIIHAARLRRRGKHSEWVLSRSAQQRHYRHDSGVRQPATARSLGDAIGSSQCGSQYFALCLAVKNNHRYIREWIAHHRAVGVGASHIVLLALPMLAGVKQASDVTEILVKRHVLSMLCRQDIHLRHRQPYTLE